ncbi:MAG: PH domain-containing protein [Emergencia sp.]|uniref:PH domain-containing protein n=1 Tax=Emergencia sp. JLR.KK010 TaxID=3114296 RepID=UPI00216D0783|nr:PH domain-containing protein [Emergencia sp.]
MESSMEYSKVDPKAIKSWRIGRGIFFLIVLAMAVPGEIALGFLAWESIWKVLIMAVIGFFVCYLAVGLVVFPIIEYKQWGYNVEEDKVVIRHGIFFIRKTIIPIIRIQNITVSQGPINRKLGLFEVEMALASGSFSIEGLDKETADAISENLKAKLYRRISEKGVL